MKTYVHLEQYLAEFFLESEMVQTNIAEKIKTHILDQYSPSPPYCPEWDNVYK